MCECACVRVYFQDTSVRLTLSAFKTGCPEHSCWRGMRPGTEPHRNNNNPHQRSSIGGTWLSTFILCVYQSSLPSPKHHSLAWGGKKKRGWFAKYKLTTNWSLAHVTLLSSFLLLTISLFLFNATSLKRYTLDKDSVKLVVVATWCQPLVCELPFWYLKFSIFAIAFLFFWNQKSPYFEEMVKLASFVRKVPS